MTTMNNALHQQVFEKITRNGGALPFDQFQSLVLYDPAHGYYASHAQQFGATGDFITAPQVSPLFGACIAHACAPLLSAFGPKTIMVEYGGGDGRLMVDIQTALVSKKSAPSRYESIEGSGPLRALQKSRWEASPIASYPVQWVDTPSAAPIAIIIANELWDAMPVRCFEITATGIMERIVCFKNNELTWGTAPASANLKAAVQALESELGSPFPVGYHSEIWLGAAAWLEKVFAPYEQAILISFDYGFSRKTYYHPDRHMGTLMCHHRHQAHGNPFVHLGDQDITAHVDFTSIAQAADQLALEVLGFCPQAAFLLENDLLAHAAENTRTMQSAIHTLTSPNEMGEIIKVVAIGKNIPISMQIPGFSLINHLNRL